MRLRSMAIAGVTLLAFNLPTWAAQPIDLKVFYAGNPGSDREKDFKAFLEEHFAKVATTSYEKFQEKEANGHDVVILDWTSIYPRDEHGRFNFNKETFRLNKPTPPKLSEDYDRPTILIGAAGAYATRSLQLKINWL